MAAVLTAVSLTAHAQCQPRAAVMDHLAEAGGEIVVMGLTTEGALLELVQMPDRSWVVFITAPARPEEQMACDVATGSALQAADIVIRGQDV